MTRIGGIGSLATSQLKALNRLQQLGKAIAENQVRLTTLKRINSAKDDPSGLVAVSHLEQQLVAAQAASEGVTRAHSILGTADKAASEIVSQLQSARSLVLQAAGGTLSSSEVAANQIEVDTILKSINSLAQTEFGGQQLLTGASGYLVSGTDNTTTLDVDVLSKSSSGDVTVDINVTTTATQATNDYQNGALGSDTTLIVTGSTGATTISLSSGATTDDITAAFNAVTHLTGISATKVDANEVDFASVEYGTDESITVEATQGTFALTTSGTTTGTDAIATINGQSYTGSGSKFNVNTSDLALVVELSPTASGNLSQFNISGKGLNFVIGSSASATASVGLPNLLTSSLGGVTGSLISIGSGGANSLVGGKSTEALQILDDAIADATRGQAVIGSFQKYTLDPSKRVLTSTIENISSSLSIIRDTDVALETAKLANNRLLQQTTFEVLSISSFRSESVLGLLKSTAARF